MKFLFDFDGTLSVAESLPFIAERFGMRERMDPLTRNAVNGADVFEENFKLRVGMMSVIPHETIADVMKELPLRKSLVDFILRHSDDCAVVTANIDIWVAPLLETLGCEYFCSRYETDADGNVSASGIIDKVSVIDDFKRKGFRTIFIGDGANDRKAMLSADISVAFLASEFADSTLAEVATYVCRNETELAARLETLVRL